MPTIQASAIVAFWLIASVVTLISLRSVASQCIVFFSGWLFLPQFRIDLPVIFLTKYALISIVIFSSVFVVGPNRQWRLSVADIPVGLLCLAAFVSSLTNGFGVYDGFVVAVGVFLIWGAPWFVGRMIFGTPESLNLFVKSFVIATVVYAPFCIFEVKFSPVLHSIVFGYGIPGRGSFQAENLRYGLWRPTVFMEFGLQLALFMGMGSVLAYATNVSRVSRELARVPLSMIALGLAALTVICVSSGAILLTIVAWTIISLSRLKSARTALLAISLLPVLYPVYRMTNIGEMRLEVSNGSEEIRKRQASLNTRLINEDLMLERWLKNPFFGATSRN